MTNQPLEAIAVISNESLLQKHDFNIVTPGIICRFCNANGQHYSLYCPTRGQGGQRRPKVQEQVEEKGRSEGGSNDVDEGTVGTSDGY